MKRLYLVAEIKVNPAKTKDGATAKRVEAARRDWSDARPHPQTGRRTYTANVVAQMKSSYELLLLALHSQYPDWVDALLTGEPRRFQSGDLSVELCSMASVRYDARQVETVAVEKTKQAALGSWRPEVALPLSHRPELISAPAKMTVSELKRQADQNLILDHRSGSFDGEPDVRMVDGLPDGQTDAMVGMDAFSDMAFELNDWDQADKSPSASELGTWLHTLFQFLDIRALREGGSAAFEALLDDMVSKQRIRPEQRDVLAAYEEYALAFAESDLAADILDVETKNPEHVHREMPFTIAIPALGVPEAWGEVTLVQGMIDLWFVNQNGEATLIDFKSDVLTGSIEKRDSALLNRYTTQLRYYAEAIEKAAKRRVDRGLIWLIREKRFVVIL